MVFVVEAVGLAVGLLFNAMLYDAIKKKYPKYYDQIGQPKVLGCTKYAPTRSDVSQRLRGNRFILSLVFNGAPEGFPKDFRLQKLMSFVRYIFSGLFVLFLPLVVLFYVAFK